MNAEKLFRDYRINYAEPGEDNYRDGWVNTQCPFCDDASRHLGISDTGIANCWRCGWKPLSKAIAKLLNISEQQARSIIRQYGGKSRRQAKEVKRKPRAKALKLPLCTPLQNRHKKYLTGRDFDPERIEKMWRLKGTGPIAKLDKTDYRFRIIAPIFWDNKMVSFQGRDITGKHKVKYMACPQDREIIEHQTVLYGRQGKWEDTGLCVEGITDVWRLGYRSFATFGIDFTRHQVREISKHFKRVLILFDPEPQAQKQANKLKKELLFRNVQTEIIDLQSDPGDLSEKDAKDLIKRIF